MKLDDYGPAVKYGTVQIERGKHLLEAAHQRESGSIVRVFHADSSQTCIVYPPDTNPYKAARLAIEDLKDCECAAAQFVEVSPAVEPSVPEVLDRVWNT